jgi:hypothetical protein
MTIKFSKSAGNQELLMDDSTGLTFPNTDWAMSWTMVFDGDTTSADNQYLFATGSISRVGTLTALYYPLGVDSSAGYPGKLVVFPDQGTICQSTSQFSTGAYVFVLQRSNGVFTLRSTPVRTSAPTSGSGVVTEFSKALTVALDGGSNNDGSSSKFAIGGRSYFPVSGWLDQSLGRIFRYDGTLTDLEVAQLAYGKEITDLGKSPAWYIRMNTASDTTDLGTLKNVVTVNGSPVTGTNPGFGYSAAPAPVTPTVTSVSITPLMTSISAGTTQQFTSVVNGTNSPSQSVTWSASNGGVIDSNGLFTGPTGSSNTQFVITATSIADSTKFSTAAITVLAQVASTPTPVYPSPDKVTLGVKYGPTGVEYTGTYASNSNESLDDIVQAIWADDIALSVPRFLATK